MWPFSEMSLETATSWFDFANLIFLLSLLFGVLSTFAIVRLGNVKEHHWDLARDQSRELVKGLELETAKANQKAEEERLARIKIEEKLAPRRITQEDQNFISAQISEFKGVVGGIGTSPRDIESMRLESAVHAAIAVAGWNLTRAIPSHTPMWPGGVVVNSTFDKGSQMAGIKLALALNSVGIFAIFMPILENVPPQVFVTIGPKPDPDDPLLKINLDVLKQLALELQKQ